MRKKLHETIDNPRKTAKYISDKLRMPISHGERVYSRWQYAPYFEEEAVQIIQSDIGNCGRHNGG